MHSDYNNEFLDENEAINRDLKAVNNFKAGAEVRIDFVYLRGGFQYLASPYADSRNNADEFVYSGGIGVRTKAMFFDISYAYGHSEQAYSLYSPAPGVNEVSINQVNRNNIMVTTGIKF